MTPLTLTAPQIRAPWHPYLVLAVAIFLPGFGYVLLGRYGRGLTMQLFMISLAFVTWHLTTPHHSLIGRLAGGLFVYAMTLPEVYRLARLRWTTYRNTAMGLPSS